jgi:pimeloyl-ACP methyl ester carboxylesterase
MLRLLAIGLLWIAIAAVALIGAGLGYRAWRIHEAETALAISSPNGIDEAMFVPIGDSEQWITIRGQDLANPVVLLLHGGPGAAMAPFALSFRAYENAYTVVQWDQPGAAKTFRRARGKIAPDLTIANVAADGIAIAEFLKAHLRTEKMILLGWSWGSIVGIEMTRARPDLFAAYVGTGQIANIQAGEALVYSRVLSKARQQGNARAISELEAIGPPPYDSQAELGTQRDWASVLAGEGTSAAQILALLPFIPRYSVGDTLSYVRGFRESQNHFFGPELQGPLMEIDFPATATAFQVPIIFIQGTEDDFTPAELARRYLDQITAPRKAFVPLEGAGHSALIVSSEEFLAAMNERVRPLAMPALDARR